MKKTIVLDISRCQMWVITFEIHHLKQSFTSFYKCLLDLNSHWALFALLLKARKALPGLLGTLSTGTKTGNESDDTLAMACLTANCLLMKEPEMSKPLLNNNLINSLKDISQNG